MNTWDAIAEMRRLSKEGKSFSFAFMSCDLARRQSQGIVEVAHARFLSREMGTKYEDADIIERYINLDTMEARRFYQPLLMAFNGESVELT